MIYTINESDISEKVKDKVNRTRSKIRDGASALQNSISRRLYDRYERAGKVPDIKEKRDSILADNKKRYEEQKRIEEEQRRRYEEKARRRYEKGNHTLSNKNNHIQESTIFDNIEII